jgi:hypothetical protein
VQGDGHGDRLVVVDNEGRQRGAGRKLVTAVNSALRPYRVSELAQPVDVPPERAR